MSNLSPAPGTPQTPTKAVIAAVVSFLGAFIVALSAAVADRTDLDSMKTDEWFVVILGALATACVTGGLTYTVRNQAKG